MAAVRAASGYMLDPHSAVAYGAATRVTRDPHRPLVVLATAHPAKFPDAVEQATGARPPLPSRLAKVLDLPERYTVLPNELAAVEAFVEHAARPG
jgi:threonine synthase